MDKNMERRVWQRVYGRGRPPRPPIQQLRCCLARSEENLRFYEGQSRDPVYGPAFERMAVETREHCKMLKSMMGR